MLRGQTSASLRQRNRSAQGCPGAQNLDGDFHGDVHGDLMGILWQFLWFFSWNFCRVFMAISVGFCGDIMIIMGFSRMLAAI